MIISDQEAQREIEQLARLCKGSSEELEVKESCEEGEYRQTRFYLDSLDNLLKIAKSAMGNPALMRKEVANGLIKVQVVLFGIYTKVYVATQMCTTFTHQIAI